MSQYPPNPNYNPNPYGQNPPDPNPGTAYGGPPSGPNQNPYNPYPNTTPAPDPNSGPYGPYGNPPTPAPPPYNPYAPTVAGSSPNYNQYGAPPAPPTQPTPTTPRRGPSMRVIIIAAIVLVLIIGGIVIGLVGYSNGQQSNANATATAQANANASATARANAAASATAIAATATAVATTFPFSANQVLNDPLSDNSKGYGWQTTDSCKFQGSAYHVLDPQTKTFNSCSALKTDFKDFTFEVEAVLNSGDGIGITFRGNGSQFYRLDISTDGSYGLYVYVDTSGTNARTLTSGNITPAPNMGNTNNIAVVARGSTIQFYFNQTVVTSVNDPTYSHGQIGLETVNLTQSADAVFTNAQVWALP